MKAELITIGDEILIGQTIDTNSAWMAKNLRQVGINIDRITSISDTHEAIILALREAQGRSEVILLTGGLGPTKDDITKSTLCNYFKTRLIRNEEVLFKIEQFFSERGRVMLESNRMQADLPEACTILPNNMGTACGMWFEKEGNIFVSMPGVPYEMKGLMKEQVIPRLKERFKLPELYHKTIMTEGIGESFLAEKVKHWEEELEGDQIKIAYLPSPGIVKVRLSIEGNEDLHIYKEKLIKRAEEFKKIVPEYVFGEDDITVPEAIGIQLRNIKQTVSTAESCTGGHIAHLLTSIAGSSDYFKGSIVSYSNEVKTKLLGVEEDILKNYGAVSRQVVEQMAMGVRKRMDTDYALATSGVAGPSGGSDEKPVGTVWIAIATDQGVYSKKFLFEKDRSRNIRRASLAALSILRRTMNKQLALSAAAKNLV